MKISESIFWKQIQKWSCWILGITLLIGVILMLHYKGYSDKVPFDERTYYLVFSGFTTMMAFYIGKMGDDINKEIKELKKNEIISNTTKETK